MLKSVWICLIFGSNAKDAHAYMYGLSVCISVCRMLNLVYQCTCGMMHLSAEEMPENEVHSERA